MSANTLLILQDSPDFGGHEAMFLRFLPGLMESGAFRRIVIRYAEGNSRFADRLAALSSPTIDAEPWPFVKRRAEPYLAPFRRNYAKAVRGLIAAERPAALLLLQGRIENLAVPMLVASPETFLVSYVPMAHGMADLGRASMPGDLVRRRLYRRPDRFIVPSAAVASQVHAAGGRKTIVVDNVVTPPPRPDRLEARERLELPASARIALFLGRLDVRQKGLDMLADAIRRDGDRLGKWTFLIVGEGEGRPIFDTLAREYEGRIDLRCISWTDRPHDYLAAADLLLMPSRWEGVPLVMLEALAYGVPVLGSDIDVFREFLPETHRVDFAVDSLADTMATAVAPAGRAAFADRAMARDDVTALSHRFVAALQQ
jgi:glycosyltransferase involved in cell wall biosynthesis